MSIDDIRATVHALGQAVYNMPYTDFCTALDIEDDYYARQKYTDLKALARALTPFSDVALARLTAAHLETAQ